MLSLSCQWGEVCKQVFVCVCVCICVCEGVRERVRERERRQRLVLEEDYPVKRLPATRSSSPPLTPSLPHPLSHHPQYWRGLSEQVIRGEPTKLTQTQCLNNPLLIRLLHLPVYSVNIFDFSFPFCQFPFFSSFLLGVHLPFYLLFLGHEVFSYNMILT